MVKAHEAPLLHSDGGGHMMFWCQRWKMIICHSDSHYILPGGATGCHCVDELLEEVQHGNYPSERVLVFSAVILQHDYGSQRL